MTKINNLIVSIETKLDLIETLSLEKPNKEKAKMINRLALQIMEGYTEIVESSLFVLDDILLEGESVTLNDIEYLRQYIKTLAIKIRGTLS